MKELTSKSNKQNVQIVSNETYDLMVKDRVRLKNMHKRFIVRDLPSRPLKDVPTIISAPVVEKKTKPKKKINL